jgi:FtsP/CotA-like multicopper oxidase with cupredoxin domain
MVRGPVDDLPDMAAAKELIFLYQAPYYATEGVPNNYGSANGTLENFSQLANNPSGNAPQNGNTNNGYVYVQPVLINGVRRPTIVMQSGEVQRWRLMNTQVFNYLNINLDDHVLYQYTSDGWGSAVYREYPDARLRDGFGVKLAASNRASVVVKAGKPGTNYLRPLPLQFAQGNGSSILPEDILATILVVDSSVNMAIPATPLPVSPLLAPITDEEFASAGGKKRNIVFRSISNALLANAPKTSPITDSPASTLLPAGSDASNWVYNANATTMQNTAFVIGANETVANPNYATPTGTTNPSQYYPFQSSSAPTQTIILGAVEEWTVFNMNSISHPFHIHVNPMYVTKINGIPVVPFWCDTQALPINGTPNAPKSITFRMRFVDYAGPYVMHCHMLQHEDMGMMQRVTVVPA